MRVLQADKTDQTCTIMLFSTSNILRPGQNMKKWVGRFYAGNMQTIPANF